MTQASRKVLIADPVHSSLIQSLSEDHEVMVRPGLDVISLRQLIPSVDAIVMRSGIGLGEPEFRLAPQLRFVARAGVGTDNIDLVAARAHGVTVFNVPDASSTSVAELTFGLILAASRNLVLADRQIQVGEWRKGELSGTELFSKTLGIIGYGRIGRKVAGIAQGFGMNVIASVSPETAAWNAVCSRQIATIVATERVLREADIISLHCPLNSSTRDLINAQVLAAMKPGAILINMARGGVVNETALMDALVRGRIAAAATDVLAQEGCMSPLSKLNNFVATPHIGAMTEEAQKNIAHNIYHNLQRAFNGQEISNCVN